MRKFSNKKLADALNDPRYNLSAIAKMADISRSYLDGLLKGDYKNPGANFVVALADILEKPLEYFFEDDCQHAVKEAS